MGATYIRKSELVGLVSERIGYKSGLALTIEQFADLLKGEEAHVGFFLPPFDTVLRIRSEEYEDLFSILLYKVGATAEIEFGFLVTRSSNPAHREMAVQVAPYFTKHLSRTVDAGGAHSFDPGPLVNEVWEKLGPVAAEVALDMVDRLARYLNNSPWNFSRAIDWKDTRPLDELFASEKLDSFHGEYFDQRFINFIHANFDQITEINWRQFEGLTAEYLGREGYAVEIGPGRDDGNIDIRCWTNEKGPGTPPTMLVQCKRQKDKVEKVVVKALWADMQEENVESGLIVTTSALAPGAREVVTARNYQIDEANRRTLREWVAAMRSPGSGIIMAE